MRNIPAYIIIAALALSLIAIMPVNVKAEAVGYLAIKDYLGRTWSIQDVQKIINTTVNTPDGLKSLADYFWIVVDDDPENKKYSLKDFIASPLDNVTAVLPLPAGDHYVDIYWFGFHQRQLVNIAENYTYILNLQTAPVMPFPYSGEPPTSSYEWDLASNPEGLTITRRDGNAYVRFMYNNTYVQVAWYDEDTGWNYQALDININSGYQWRFHITDPANPKYVESVTGSFLWFTWENGKTYETVKWNRTGEILHVTYAVTVAENKALEDALDEFWKAAGTAVLALGAEFGLCNHVLGTIFRIKAFADFVQSFNDNFWGTFLPSKYQKTIVIIWDVFATPTQVVVLAHAYDVDENGNYHERPITSANVYTVNNRLVYVKQLSGGYTYTFLSTSSWSSNADTHKDYTFIPGGDAEAQNTLVTVETATNTYEIHMPLQKKFYVSDLSMFDYEMWFSFWTRYYVASSPMTSFTYQVKIIFGFNNTEDADLFADKLSQNGISYSRSGNEITITVKNVGGNTGNVDYVDFFTFDNIEQYLPNNAPGYVKYYVYIHYKWTGSPGYGTIGGIKFFISVVPKMIPPQISILKDGYQKVSGAFAVQVFTDLLRSEEDYYMLGYYILDNPPPPCYVIRDVYYDLDSDVVHYVYTLIVSDIYGQDIVDMSGGYDSSLQMTIWYLNIKPTVRTIDTTLALFSFSKMSFLNLAPEVIEYIVAVPLGTPGGLGVPIIDWSQISLVYVNTTANYELYYYEKSNNTWVRVTPVFYNDTLVYDIVRYSDNVLVEVIPPGNMSKYYYKYVNLDESTTYKGWLFNDNGVLKLITGEVTWSVTEEELNLMLEMANLEGILDQWEAYWNSVAEQLGLLAEAASSAISGGGGAGIAGEAWLWLLIGLGGGFVLAIILLVAIGGRGPTVVLARFASIRFTKVGEAKCKLLA